jgi:hypothetical protein
MIIIISTKRRPLLDIVLPQSCPLGSVLCCPHPAASRDLHQIVGPSCGGLTSAATPGTRSPFAPTAVSPPRNVPCPLPLEVCNSSGYVGDLSSFTDLIISDSITDHTITGSDLIRIGRSSKPVSAVTSDT